MLLGSWRRPLRGMPEALPEPASIRNYLIVTVLTLLGRGSSLRGHDESLRHGERRRRPPAVHVPARRERAEPRGPDHERRAHPLAHGRRVQVERRARRPERERPVLRVVHKPSPCHGVWSARAWVAVEVDERSHKDREHEPPLPGELAPPRARTQRGPLRSQAAKRKECHANLWLSHGAHRGKAASYGT